MHRPIIVEGPDGSGKTTLLLHLSYDLHTPIFHTGGPPASLASFRSKVRKAEEKMQSYILDRTPHISELVYGNMNGRTCYATQEVMMLRLAKLKPVIIYCRLASDEKMHELISEKVKEHKPEAHLKSVKEEYQGILDRYASVMAHAREATTVLDYSWDRQLYTNLLKEIKACAG